MKSTERFEEIYRLHGRAVFRVCLRLVSRREIAEDLTSEVFLALQQSWDMVTDEMQPAWLFTVARRRAADYWRKRYLEERWEAEYRDEVLWTEPEHKMEEILASCTALKPIHRVCLTLRFAQGMSREEIARQTGLTELQVKGYLQYALELLRQSIQPGLSRRETRRTHGTTE